MSWEDLKSGASITRDTQGNYVLKEVEYKTIKFPCSAEEEDVEENRVSRHRRGPGRGSESEGERESRRRRESKQGRGAPVHSRLGLRRADQWDEEGSGLDKEDTDQDEDES